ncbi:MAG: DUF4019 domain-containing protein [Verrucomicrobiaceae bacterium]|nr:MAG: DUF4019 domain-containing protein [Verrucomicrobiaceae bacterium]
MGMDRMPDDASMENPPHPPLAGLDPADLLKQGAAEDTFPGETVPAFSLPPIEELAPLFPQFEIIELIGQGGMGAVYKVRQKELDRIVALKILPPSIGEAPGFAERFTREARALAKLNHPGIVTLHEFGQREGLYFILMEFVDGVNLAQLMKVGRVAARQALTIVPQICDALQFAHDKGIVHRDIKPENILLDRVGRVKVADFGIAKVVAAVCEQKEGEAGCVASSEVTLAGKVIGTPRYMAPEQIDNPGEVDHRADIYALGVVFYQMLTGELPDKELHPPSRKVGIDVRLDEIVLRALEARPELRYQQASSLKTIVEDFRQETPEHSVKFRTSVLRVIAGVVLILCLPLSIAIVAEERSHQLPLHHEEQVFKVPDRGSYEDTERIVKDALRPFRDISVYANAETSNWRISSSALVQAEAGRVVERAAARVASALESRRTSPLAEVFIGLSSGSSSSAVRHWSLDRAFVEKVRVYVLVGALLSAGGLLLLASYKRNAPAARGPGLVATALLILGAAGVYLAWNFFRTTGPFMVVVAAMTAGIPAIVLGFSARSGWIGRTAAAGGWLGIIGALTFVYLPVLPHTLENYGAWKKVTLSAPLPGDDPFAEVPVVRDDQKEKIDGAARWLELLDSGKYKEAWMESATLARSLQGEEPWINMIRSVREPLGKVKARKWVGSKHAIRMEGFPDGRYMTFTFDSVFTIGKGNRERVSFLLEENGYWRVLSYSVEPKVESSARVLVLERGTPFVGVDLDSGSCKIYQKVGAIDDPAGAVKWRQTNGIDLLLDQKSAVPGVLLTGAHVGNVSARWWDQMPDGEMVESFLPAWKGGSGFDERMTFLAASGPSAGTRTHIFKTSRGGLGILRFEPSSSATGVKVEWRMVKPGNGDIAPAKAEGSSLVMASGAAVNPMEIRVEMSGQEADKVLRTEVASNGELLFLGKEVVIDDSHVRSAFLGAGGGNCWVDVTLNPEGAERLAGATNGQPGKMRLVVLVNDKVVSAPVVNGALSDQFQIYGFKTVEEALALLKGLPAGNPRKGDGTVRIDILSSGDVRLDGAVMAPDQLPDVLSKPPYDPKNDRITIRGDAGVSYQRVVDVINICQKIGLWNLSFSSARDERKVTDGAKSGDTASGTAAEEKIKESEDVSGADATRQSLAEEYMRLLSRFLAVKSGGIGERHPSFITAKAALDALDNEYPVLPKDFLLKLADEKRVEMAGELAKLKSAGIGEKHPMVLAKLKEMELFEEAIRKKTEPVDDGDQRLAGVIRWLETLDAGNHGESYAALAPAASSQLTLQQWEFSMNTARKPLGALVSRKFLVKEPLPEIPGQPGAEGMVYQFSSEFAEKNPAVETVILMKVGKEWKPAGYYIK